MSPSLPTYSSFILQRADSVLPERLEEILKDFHKECHVGFGIESIMTARTGDLSVMEMSQPFEVKETEGAERVVETQGRGRRNINL